MTDLDGLSKTEREALKAIHRITVERRRGEEPTSGARTGDLSNDLGLTPGTITSTIKHLAEAGLVDHHPYRGVTLTDEGMDAAIAAIRRHRIVERFLSDKMDYSWHEADRLAPFFEHSLPSEMETRMWEILEHPTTCPHGFSIPEPDNQSLPQMESLFDLQAGATAIAAVPGSLDKEIVAYLDEAGIYPGVEVAVIDIKPVDGTVSLSVAGETRTIGERVARNVFVRRTEIEKEQTA